MNPATRTACISLSFALVGCVGGSEPEAAMKVFETSRSGNALTEVSDFGAVENPAVIRINS